VGDGMKTEREYLKNDIDHRKSKIEYLNELNELNYLSSDAIAKRWKCQSTERKLMNESKSKLKELDFIEYCNTGRFPE
jgi:hypothetical protein